jgi:hypothetical protein
VAKIDTRESTNRMPSRFHSGQFYRSLAFDTVIRLAKCTRGSFGSSLGCGTRMIGMGPLLSHLRPTASSEAIWGRSRSSKYRVVPYNQISEEFKDCD